MRPRVQRLPGGDRYSSPPLGAGTPPAERAACGGRVLTPPALPSAAAAARQGPGEARRGPGVAGLCPESWTRLSRGRGLSRGGRARGSRPRGAPGALQALGVGMADEAMREGEERWQREDAILVVELVLVVGDLRLVLQLAVLDGEDGEDGEDTEDEEEAREVEESEEDGEEDGEEEVAEDEAWTGAEEVTDEDGEENGEEEEAEEGEEAEEADKAVEEEGEEAVEVEQGQGEEEDVDREEEGEAEDAEKEEAEEVEVEPKEEEKPEEEEELEGAEEAEEEEWEEEAEEEEGEEEAEGEEAKEEDAEEDVAEEEGAEECEEPEEGEEAEEAEEEAEHEDQREEGPKEEEEAQELQEKQKGEEEPEAQRAPSLSSLEALEALQSDLKPVNEEASRSYSRLKLRYRQGRQRLLEQRSTLIRGIRGFWAKAFVNHPQMSAMMCEEDEGLLGYMTDLKVEELSFPRDCRKILLFFRKNPYFRNNVVGKEYVLSAAGYGPSHSTPIQWHQTYEREAYSRRHHNTSPNFFNWFSDHSFAGSSRIAEVGPSGKEREGARWVPRLLGMDLWALPRFPCQIILDDLWPNPLQYYVRQKAPGEGTERRTGSVRMWR